MCKNWLGSGNQARDCGFLWDGCLQHLDNQSSISSCYTDWALPLLDSHISQALPLLACKDVDSINYLPSCLWIRLSHSYSDLFHNCARLAFDIYVLPSDLSFHGLIPIGFRDPGSLITSTIILEESHNWVSQWCCCPPLQHNLWCFHSCCSLWTSCGYLMGFSALNSMPTVTCSFIWVFWCFFPLFFMVDLAFLLYLARPSLFWSF